MDQIDVIFVRVSTRQQDERSQKADLQTWEKTRTAPVQWFHDCYTGKSMDRPGWNKLYKLILAGKVKTLCVWRLDRLGRTAEGLTKLFNELVRLKVNFVSLREGIDLSTPSGRMIATVIAAMAEFETEIRSERVRAGQAAARAAGKKWGGRKQGCRVKVTDEQLTQIKKLKSEGEKIARIARATGLSRQTIYQYVA